MLQPLAAPMIAALGVAVVATSAHRRLPPRLAARFVSTALILSVVAALPTAIVIAVAFLAHVPLLRVGFEWCAQAIGVHQSVPTWLGVSAVTLLSIGAVRTLRLLREHQSLRLNHPTPIHIADSERPFAVTLPGRAGQIVISSALINALEPDEQQIVIEHERAHARYRHDRYLLVSELAAAALPPLRGLSKRVAYSIERWADEAAAAACGDRELVAITLGKVALRSEHPTVAAFAGLGVASRMAAIMEPPIRRPRPAHVLALWTSVGLTALLSVYQLHHLEGLLAALCPH